MIQTGSQNQEKRRTTLSSSDDSDKEGTDVDINLKRVKSQIIMKRRKTLPTKIQELPKDKYFTESQKHISVPTMLQHETPLAFNDIATDKAQPGDVLYFNLTEHVHEQNIECENVQQENNDMSYTANNVTDPIYLQNEVNQVHHEEEVVTQPYEYIAGTMNAGGERHVPEINNECQERSQKGFGNKNNWNCNVQKKLRMTGSAYVGIKKVDGKKKYCAEKNAKIMKEKTCGNRCRKSRKCFEISEENRKSIFDAFWNSIDWDAKKCMLLAILLR
jgi:hypothetical protein